MSEGDDKPPVTGTPSDNTDNLSDLNSAAWHALLGMSTDWAGDVSALLRSKEPIHHWVRTALAELIEQTTPLKLKLTLSGHKSLRDSTQAVSVRRDWVRIGNWIAISRESGKTREAATAEAEIIYECSFELCDMAYDYRNRYSRWRSSLTDDHPFLGVLSETGIENMFHQMEHHGEPLDGPDGIEIAKRTIDDCFN